MNMDEKTIKEALRKGERVTLECKRAKAEVPKSVWATYSAFANTIGGLILLGVDDDMQEKDILKRYQIIGVERSWGQIDCLGKSMTLRSWESFFPRKHYRNK